MLHFLWRYRDETTVEEGAQRACFVFTATHRSTGKGRAIPQEGTLGSQPCGMGGAGGAGLARTAFA